MMVFSNGVPRRRRRRRPRTPEEATELEIEKRLEAFLRVFDRRILNMSRKFSNDYEGQRRAYIIDMYASGKEPAEIALAWDVSEREVRRILREFRNVYFMMTFWIGRFMQQPEKALEELPEWMRDGKPRPK